MSAERGNLISIEKNKSHSIQAGVKRSLDLILATSGLFFLFPWLLLLAALVRLTSPGPALYRQKRVGKNGDLFDIIKFRTMNHLHERNEIMPSAGDPNAAISWDTYQKLWHDPRLTRIGWFMRKTSLDELPQLINVLKGDMSLVGPRPILPEQKEIYGTGFSNYIQVQPGVTGLWQVSGRNRLAFAKRVELDQEYINSWSLYQDALILMQTVIVVIRGDGAY